MKIAMVNKWDKGSGAARDERMARVQKGLFGERFGAEVHADKAVDL